MDHPRIGGICYGVIEAVKNIDAEVLEIRLQVLAGVSKGFLKLGLDFFVLSMISD